MKYLSDINNYIKLAKEKITFLKIFLGILFVLTYVLLLHDIGSNDYIIGAMEHISMMLVALLVPLVFLLINDSNSLVEKKVIAKYVVGEKRVGFFILLLSVSFFYWGDEFLRPVLLIYYLISMSLFMKTVYLSYRWLFDPKKPIGKQGFRSLLVEKYLEDENNWEEKSDAWYETWESDLDAKTEEQYLPKFIKDVDGFIKTNNYKDLYNYIAIYNFFSKKRNFLYPSILTKISDKLLEWDFEFFKNKDNESVFPEFSISKYNVRDLIKKCLIFSLKKYSSLFFSLLNKHSKGKENDYLDDFFGNFVCEIFFQHIGESPERFAIWGDGANGSFPSSWKVTKETAEDDKNHMSKVWYAVFLNFLGSKINDSSRIDIDRNLEEASSKLFPSVEPLIWAPILTYIFSWERGDNRMESLINKPKIFGFMGRSYHVSLSEGISLEEKQKIFINDTYKLAVVLFKNGLKKDELSKCIDELDRLTHYDDTEINKIMQRDQYKMILIELRNRLDDN